MIAPVEKKPTIKIAGYLEKRGKMRVVCRWKRWWFVLEGRLLLYYKSQLEYVKLSPCRGSLNLGLASSVVPGKGLELQVVTRSQTVTLRAGNRTDHDQWLQALVDAMALQGSLNPFCLRPVQHFRYANENDILDQTSSAVKRVGRSYTLSTTPTDNYTSSDTKETEETASLISETKIHDLPSSPKRCIRRCMSFSNDRLKHKNFDRNSIRHSIRHSKIAFSDTSIPVSVHNQLSPAESTEKCQSLRELQDSFFISADNHDYAEIDLPQKIPFIFVENLCDSKSKVHRSGDLDCNGYARDNLFKSSTSNIIGSSNSVNNYVHRNDLKELDNDKNKLNVLYQTKQVKSDTDLTLKKKYRNHSSSCGEISVKTNTRLVKPAVNPVMLDDKPLPGVSCENDLHNSSNKSRSNSMLRKSSKDGKDEHGLQRRGTLKKRSISFLRKVWKKREKKEEQDYETVDYESIPACIEIQKTPAEEVVLQKPEESQKSLSSMPDPEPTPDYDTSFDDAFFDPEIPPMLPPRQKIKRPHSPWHDVPTNNMPVLPPDGEPPPALPEKTRNKSKAAESGSMYCVNHQEISYKHDGVYYQSETTVKVSNINNMNIDALLAELSEININEAVEKSQSTKDVDAEPDYDIPRPHTSLLNSLRRYSRPDSLPATNFFCSTPIPEKDTLDSMLSRFSSEMDITPDSLECDTPWSLTGQAEVSDITWPRPAMTEMHSLQRHFITAEDKIFEDSLNS